MAMMDEIQQQARLEEVIQRGMDIVERLDDQKIALRELRDGLDQAIRRACDITVNKNQEANKRLHISAMRATLVGVDRMLAFGEKR